LKEKKGWKGNEVEKYVGERKETGLKENRGNVGLLKELVAK